MGDEHFAPLGHVAILNARLEQVAGWIFGLLLDLDDARVGDVVGAPMSVSQVLDRTLLLAPIRLENTEPVQRWVRLAREATQLRNQLLHSAWHPQFDHATGQESLLRQRLTRSGEWDVDREVTVDFIRAAATKLMIANAAGTNAYITTERALIDTEREARG